MAPSTKNANKPAQSSGKRKYVKKNKKHWANLKGKTKAAKSIDLPTDNNVEPFEIETAPPHFRLNPDLAHTLKRVEETVKVIQPGQAFIVPSKSKHTIKKFIEEKWPLYQFMYSIIKDNTGMMRIYLLRKAKG